MEETDIPMSVVTVEEADQAPVNPLVYVATTLVVAAVGCAGFRYWQARRRKNRLAVVESLPAQEESE